jgi:methyl-accepting chemotaxis protein
VEDIRSNDIETIVDLFATSLIAIRVKIIIEQIIFEDVFEDLRRQIEGDVNTLNTSISIALIVIVSIVVLLTNISIVLSFRRLNAKFSEVTAGNLVIETSDEYSGTELGKIESDFDNLVKQLRTTLFTVQNTGDRLSGIAEELAAGSEEASASISDVSDTMREFAGGASEQNIMLNRIIEKLEDNRVEVNISAVRIGEASAFVHRVAKRTNILGLNASIEAAKAGTYGLGFNVVAEEVRNLADTSKESATEIANTIENVQTTITTLIDDILREIEIVREVAENTAAGSEEVSAATIEQVTMLTEVAQTSNDLSLLAQELINVLSRFTLKKK